MKPLDFVRVNTLGFFRKRDQISMCTYKKIDADAVTFLANQIRSGGEKISLSIY